MPINEHAESFFGLPIKDFNPDEGLVEPGGVAWRVGLSWDDHEAGKNISSLLDKLYADANAAAVRALVIGAWDFESSEDSAEIVQSLVRHASKLAGLRALFVADVVMEEQEISWIQQSDLTPLLEAFGKLETFRVRGGEGLQLRPTHHASLRELIVETGGLPREVAVGVMGSTFPNLEKLELWTGDDGYGGTTALSDFRPILEGNAFPKLRVLGIRDSQYSDQAAQALAASPRLSQLRVVDLSLGTFSDAGAKAVLARADAVKHLELLDLRHHYLSDSMMSALQASGIKVDLADKQDPHEDDDASARYVAVGE